MDAISFQRGIRLFHEFVCLTFIRAVSYLISNHVRRQTLGLTNDDYDLLYLVNLLRRWFDIVFVLRTETTRLYDRLQEKNYNHKKVENNLQCEIFQTILDEARESYNAEIVHELKSHNTDDIENNLEQILSWIEQWKTNANTNSND